MTMFIFQDDETGFAANFLSTGLRYRVHMLSESWWLIEMLKHHSLPVIISALATLILSAEPLIPASCPSQGLSTVFWSRTYSKSREVIPHDRELRVNLSSAQSSLLTADSAQRLMTRLVSERWPRGAGLHSNMARIDLDHLWDYTQTLTTPTAALHHIVSR